MGADRGEMYCSQLPPCPAPKIQAIDGGWGPYGQWSECSHPCGGGYRVRRRQCNDPEPQNEGMDCPGCPIDHEQCNNQACPEVKRMSQWTPWMVSSNKSLEAGQTEHRYKFQCKAPVGDPSTIKISLAKEETRICIDGSCHRSNDNNEGNGWSEFSEWSACSSPCGGGNQFRTRTCERGDGICDGSARMARACNIQPCKGLSTFRFF